MMLCCLQDYWVASTVSTPPSNPYTFGSLANAINPALSDERLEPLSMTFHFSLPFSTHGFHRSLASHILMDLISQCRDGGCEVSSERLQINVHSALPQESLEFIKKTYFRASEVYDSRYEPSLAPVIWPGQVDFVLG
jgi:hypothetical protein